MGCDDCMFETKAHEYLNDPLIKEKHVKRKVIIKDTDMRLKKNRLALFSQIKKDVK